MPRSEKLPYQLLFPQAGLLLKSYLCSEFDINVRFFPKKAATAGDFLIQDLYFFRQVLHAAADGTKHKSVVLTEFAFNCQCDCFLRTFQPSMGTKRCQVLRSSITVNHIVYNPCTSLTRNIAEDTGQLQVDILKWAYETVAFGRKVLDKLAAIAGQVTLGLIQNETAFQQTCAQQLASMRSPSCLSYDREHTRCNGHSRPGS